ncbi:MAG TPA: zinc-dependent metalloprotease, partial [Dyadobacter sp.]|nr:zinc-dependent metalloprotease [Dyadobacter sp.]
HALGMYHNHMSSSNDRSSVTDYPFPKITMKADGTIDISDAYSKGIGSYDKRAIIWGYTEFGKNQNEKAELNKIIQESVKQGHIFMFDLGIHPNSAHWDNTGDAVAELSRLMLIRKKALSVFSEKAIPAGRPMATLEEVLVPLYLLHRYQIEAATNLLGGLNFRYALRGDGQPITEMIDPAQQGKALDVLISSITADELAIPEKVIKNLPPYPIGYSRNQENFKGYTGVTFDPIGAAESLTGQTLSLILDHERAARLLEYHGRDANQPGLISVIEKLSNQIWKAPADNGYKADLQSMVRKVYLKTLLGLAANTGASDNVKATVLGEIDNLKIWMSGQKATADAKLKGDIMFSLLQISQFEKDPDKFKPIPPAQMPAGPAI